MSTLLLKQLSRSRQALLKAVDGLDERAFEEIPTGFNNNIRWQMGHILVATELFVFNGQSNFPKVYPEYFGPGTSPADWSGEEPSAAQIIQLLKDQTAAIEKIDTSMFDVKLEKPKLGNETVGEFAAMGIFHEAMHIGQIQSLRKIIEVSLLNEQK